MSDAKQFETVFFHTTVQVPICVTLTIDEFGNRNAELTKAKWNWLCGQATDVGQSEAEIDERSQQRLVQVGEQMDSIVEALWQVADTDLSSDIRKNVVKQLKQRFGDESGDVETQCSHPKCQQTASWLSTIDDREEPFCDDHASEQLLVQRPIG
jgi:hypothetical protein